MTRDVSNRPEAKARSKKMLLQNVLPILVVLFQMAACACGDPPDKPVTSKSEYDHLWESFLQRDVCVDRRDGTVYLLVDIFRDPADTDSTTADSAGVPTINVRAVGPYQRQWVTKAELMVLLEKHGTEMIRPAPNRRLLQIDNRPQSPLPWPALFGCVEGAGQPDSLRIHMQWTKRVKQGTRMCLVFSDTGSAVLQIRSDGDFVQRMPDYGCYELRFFVADCDSVRDGDQPFLVIEERWIVDDGRELKIDFGGAAPAEP